MCARRGLISGTMIRSSNTARYHPIPAVVHPQSDQDHSMVAGPEIFAIRCSLRVHADITYRGASVGHHLLLYPNFLHVHHQHLLQKGACSNTTRAGVSWSLVEDEIPMPSAHSTCCFRGRMNIRPIVISSVAILVHVRLL